MPNYRLYRLDTNDRIMDALEFEGPNDDAAVAEAVRVDHAAVIEIWSGARKVGSVDPSNGTEGASDDHTVG
jgi:hypothetical protein